MVGFAVMFGLLAVFLAQVWLNNQADARMKSLEAQRKAAPPARTIVVAAKSMRFGEELVASAMREVEWPEGALPAGSFGKIADLTKGKRIVLAAIEPNEPILRTKITGPGQRATLSAVIEPGMKAVTVRVNDVEGVGGFVLPGDHVDVLMTRQPEKGSGNNDVVLQNVKVLAIDQLADDSADKPSVVKAVTLEVETVAAQKLSLAASLGSLSLVLRKAGEAEIEGTRRVTQNDLGTAEVRDRPVGNASIVSVTRAGQRQEYNVSREAVGAAAR